jgi:hypothetical protein
MGRPAYRPNPFFETALDFLRGLWPTSRRADAMRFDVADSENATQFFDRHGWVIFCNVFSAAEIAEFRRLAATEEQRAYSGDILTSPTLGGERFVLDPRIVGVARMLLRGQPCYYGDSTVSIDIRMMGFHKDNPDREDQAAPDWQRPYTQLRMGLYLQDHAAHSGGLSVRDGSHHFVDHAKGRPIAMQTSVGDLVVWSLRTTHSGNSMRLRGIPRLFVPVPFARLLERHVPKLVRVLARPLGVQERMALFSSFGIDDAHLERYLAYLRTRRYAVTSWKSSHPIDDRTMAKATAVGLDLKSPPPAVREIDIDALNEKHVQLPWHGEVASGVSHAR